MSLEDSGLQAAVGGNCALLDASKLSSPADARLVLGMAARRVRLARTIEESGSGCYKRTKGRLAYSSRRRVSLPQARQRSIDAARRQRLCASANGYVVGEPRFGLIHCRIRTATMGLVTLQVLDGADRGRIFENLQTTVTIGREEGNTLQLNDERVSRFHLKIQEDHDQFVLTDLDSTNGTKVNGEDIHLRILRYGDVISIGRSVLLFGSRDQIAQRLAGLRGVDVPEGGSADDSQEAVEGGAPSLDFEINWGLDPADQVTLHTMLPPDLPQRLSPAQAAQLSEMLEYLHVRIRDLLASVRIEESSDVVRLNLRQWQSLLDLQARLAVYLREIGEPKG
jgi:hypothetical protein